MEIISHNNNYHYHKNTRGFNGFMTVRSNVKSIQNCISIEEQTNLAMEDLLKTLNDFGTCLDKLLSITIYLQSFEELDAFKKVWRQWFEDKQKPEPKHFVVESPNQIKGMKLEIISTVAF